MDEKKIEEVMALADAYADVSFDQGLHQRVEDETPEDARAALLEKLRQLLGEQHG